MKNYGNLIKQKISGKLTRGNEIIESEKEFRESSEKSRGAISPKSSGKLRTPSPMKR